MNRIDVLKEKVNTLYSNSNPARAADWADYLHNKHVFIVADRAGEIAERFGANKELAMAAGMLHDVADAVMKREDPQHKEESKTIAIKFLQESDFSEKEIDIIVNDAIKHHSCRNNDQPITMEGKAMATADAVVHLTTDFYNFAIKNSTDNGESMAEIKQWGLEKIDRDFNKKIFFDEIRKEVEPDYNRLKALFSQ